MVVQVQRFPSIKLIPELNVFSLSPEGEIEYESESLQNEYLRIRIPEFPCLLNSDGSPWVEGNAYLLESVCQRLNFSAPTLASISNDLLRFLRFVDSSNINFKCVPKKRPFYPINRFSFDLKEQIDNGDLSAPTANRCLGRIEAFYAWLVEEGLVSKKLGFTSANGKLGKRRFKNTVDTKTEAEKTFLHALDFEEQRTLVEFLKKSKNIEMRLAEPPQY